MKKIVGVITLSLPLWLIQNSSDARPTPIFPQQETTNKQLEKNTQIPLQELLVSISVNNSRQPFLLLAVFYQQKLYLNKDDLHKLNLVLPRIQPITHNGQTYYLLDPSDTNYTGMKYQLNHRTLHLDLDLPASAFTLKRFGYHYQAPIANPGGYGALLNYDIVYNRFSDTQNAANQFDFAFLTPTGRIKNSVLNLIDNKQQQIIRLETNWLYDDPENMLSYTVGDARSTPGHWGNSVLYAGLQIKSDFSTQPGFSPYPTSLTKGAAKLPSTVELYLDNISLFRRNVDPGPFEIEVQPPNIGQGTLRLVTTDILGRQQFVDLPFYSSSQLLKAGLHEHGFDMGFIRQNFGDAGINYSQFFTTGTETYGINNSWTSEGRFEYTSTRQALGNTLFGELGFGLATLGSVVSKKGHDYGALGIVGYDYEQDNYYFGIRSQFASHQFTQLGQNNTIRAFRQQTQLLGGVSWPQYGQFRLSLIDQRNRDTLDQKLFTVSYSKALKNRVNLLLNVIENIETPLASTVFMYLTYTPKIHHSSVLSFIRTRTNGSQATASYSKTKDGVYGTDYRISGSAGEQRGNASANIAMSYPNAYFNSQFEKRGSEINFRGNLQGSVGYFHNNWFVSHPIDDNAFALIKVPNYPGIGIFQENRLVTKTNADGVALIPRLHPFYNNQIHINGAELPLNADAEKLTQVVLPKRGAGIYLPFEIKSHHSALITLINSNDQPLPAGTLVYQDNEQSSSPIDNSGRVYLPNIKIKTKYIAKISNRQSCQFVIEQINDKETISYLGPIKCHDINRLVPDVRSAHRHVE